MDLDQALLDAIDEQDLTKVRAALRAGASVDGPSNARWRPLSSAVLADVPSIVQELLRAGANPAKFRQNWKQRGGDFSACSLAVLQLLEASGLDLATPILLRAAEDGKPAAIDAALRKGASLQDRDSRGATAAEIALANGHRKIFSQLLAAGARLPVGRDAQASLLEDAIQNGDLKTIEALISAGINPRVRNDAGETALMWAAETGKPALVEYFLRQGLDPKAVAEKRVSGLLDYARLGGNAAIVAKLERAGAVSLRDACRALAKVLVQEFGGRAQDTMMGGEFPSAVLINPRIPGLKAQILVGASGWELNIADFWPDLPGFGPKQGGWFMLNRTKPVGFLSPDNKPVAVDAFPRYAILAARGEETSAAVVRRFCRDNEEALLGLELGEGELIFFGLGRIILRSVSSDTKQARRRVEALRRLFGLRSREVSPERGLWASELRLKVLAKGSSAKHRLGGAASEPPACAECGEATQLVVELDLRDPLLEGAPLPRETLPVFWCLECSEWGPSFYDISQRRVAASGPKGRSLPPPDSAAAEDDLPLRPAALEHGPTGKKVSRVTKVGGTAGWLQSPAVPDCPRCKKGMGFALQVASDRHVSFGDLGILYAFVCAPCRISATLVQSH